MVTSLAPAIGYDKAAQIAKLAYETGRTVRDVALEQLDLEKANLDRLLDPRSLSDQTQ
jgi:fumarate hydratase class II